MYTTYILKSKDTGTYYYGYTKDMNIRLKQHNNGKVKFTKGKRSWIVHYTEIFETKSEAFKHKLFFLP